MHGQSFWLKRRDCTCIRHSPGGQDSESGRLRRLAFAYINMDDSGQPRPLISPVDYGLHAGVIAAEDCFDRAVSSVAHPAFKSSGSR